jgi:hypothetical protein
VLWFGLVVLAGKTSIVQMQIYDKIYIMGHLWFEKSGPLVLWSSFGMIWSCRLWFGSVLVLWQDQPEPSGFPDGVPFK